jgi:DNA-binding response OmpR family regulator
VLKAVDIESVPESGSVFHDGAVTLDFARGEVTFDGNLVDLSPIEDKLLVTLVRHRDRTLIARELCELSGVDTWVSRGNIPQTKNEMLNLKEKLERTWGWAHEDSPIWRARGRGWCYRSMSG